MIRLLDEIHQRAKDEHIYYETLTARRTLERLEGLGDAAPWDLLLESGVAELQLGNEETGIERIARAYQLLQAPGSDPAAVCQVGFNLGTAYLRFAETQNCCQRRTADSCILPLRGGGLHSRQEGSKNAIRYFEDVLQKTEPKSYGHYAALWLLNLAYMTIGGYPQDVPEAYRIPPGAFESEIEFPRFRNISAELGLDTFNTAGGAIVDDFDGDDYLDIVTSTWDTKGQIRFFHNNRDGTFSDRTVQAGLAGISSGLNLVQADYDNDGDLDFLMLRGAWLFGNGRHPNSLVRNNGNGTFPN